MRKSNDSNRGSIVLETSIVLPIFILIMLFLYGIFSIVSAQNQMTHALIQSSKSLSLDPYVTEHVDSLREAKTFWSGLGSMILDFSRISNDRHFSSMDDWYNSTEINDSSMAKDRFVGFLTGGDDSAAAEKLKNLRIVNGLDGVTFLVVVMGDNMTITMKYEIQFWFDAFDLGKIPMEQSITTRLWK